MQSSIFCFPYITLASIWKIFLLSFSAKKQKKTNKKTKKRKKSKKKKIENIQKCRASETYIHKKTTKEAIMDLLLIFVITLNFVCYSALNLIFKTKRISNRFVISGGNRDKKDELGKRDQWMICNILCSLVHSVISACWTTFW